jgi:hypothetical protein
MLPFLLDAAGRGRVSLCGKANFLAWLFFLILLEGTFTVTPRIIAAAACLSLATAPVTHAATFDFFGRGIQHQILR